MKKTTNSINLGPLMLITQDAIGRAIAIHGAITPTTPEEDFAEYRRMWNAEARRLDPQYTSKSRLKASGGEYPRRK